MSIRENIAQVQSRMAAALERSGRPANSVTLVVVTKTVSVEYIREALDAGVRHLGENRIQDAAPKIEALAGQQDIHWHMIGHLQTNKAKQAVQLFDMIHALDSLHAAQEVHKRAVQQGKVMDVLFEVNVAAEESKYGLSVENALPVIQEATQLEGIAIKGLMTMAPYIEPDATRPYFQKLRELFLTLRDRNVGQMEYLSMGMTNDFEVAIEEGANIVRVGSAIFGERG